MIHEKVVTEQIKKSKQLEEKAFNENNPNWSFHQGARLALEWVNSDEYYLTLDGYIEKHYGKSNKISI
jgi:hypothetical protein